MSTLLLTFLGQAGIRLEGGAGVLYVDPCLSDYVAESADDPDRWQRRFPPPIDPTSIDDADVVLCTHEHADHLDPQTMRAIALGNGTTVFVVPASARQLAEDAVGPDRLQLARGVGDKHRFGPFSVTAVPAAHSVDYGTEFGDEGHRWLGYLIEAGGCRLYHSGDTVRHVDQVSGARLNGPVDIALLPINGRDSFRDELGITGNLWPREAAELAIELGARTLIPLHHDLFSWNGISVGVLADYVQAQNLELEVRVLTAGASTRVCPSEEPV